MTVPVKHEFELSRLEYNGKSYYVRGIAYGRFDVSKNCVEIRDVEIETCMEMPVCDAPGGVVDLVKECLSRDVIEWEADSAGSRH